MHGWLMEKNYNHLFEILLNPLQYLRSKSKITYDGRELTREFYALPIRKRIYIYICVCAYAYVTMQKEKKTKQAMIEIKFMCAQVSLI